MHTNTDKNTDKNNCFNRTFARNRRQTRRGEILTLSVACWISAVITKLADSCNRRTPLAAHRLDSTSRSTSVSRSGRVFALSQEKYCPFSRRHTRTESTASAAAWLLAHRRL